MKENYHAIGLMSGTSLDGLDMVEVTLNYSTENQWSFTVLNAKTLAYENELKEQLIHSKQLSGQELMLLNNRLGDFFGQAVNAFILENKLDKTTIDFIASHGHTVFHQPDKNFTLQIGSGAEITAKTGINVVCDFRSTDVALGGQGAPLVPIGDQFLFSNYDVCLNLGGIANLSFSQKQQALAYDVAPCNIVLNTLAQQLGAEYDESGNFARNGNVIQELLNELNALTFYAQAPPKSLGIEWIESYVFPLLEKSSLSIKDQLCTFVEHIAHQLNTAFPTESKTVLATGGGAWNTFLIERIAQISNKTIVVPDEKIVNYKEAIIFSFLGVLRMRNEVNCMQSVTGAKIDNVGGALYLGEVNLLNK
ncbi:MAG: anhydro-N-acetylmuramic acid kinase [Vicingaceae bacterium]|nr:anhydro-N-acetylmuramic acid kinase [Vicingaceae bacterium]